MERVKGIERSFQTVWIRSQREQERLAKHETLYMASLTNTPENAQ